MFSVKRATFFDYVLKDNCHSTKAVSFWKDISCFFYIVLFNVAMREERHVTLTCAYFIDIYKAHLDSLVKDPSCLSRGCRSKPHAI